MLKRQLADTADPFADFVRRANALVAEGVMSGNHSLYLPAPLPPHTHAANADSSDDDSADDDSIASDLEDDDDNESCFHFSSSLVSHSSASLSDTEPFSALSFRDNESPRCNNTFTEADFSIITPDQTLPSVADTSLRTQGPTLPIVANISTAEVGSATEHCVVGDCPPAKRIRRTPCWTKDYVLYN